MIECKVRHYEITNIVSGNPVIQDMKPKGAVIIIFNQPFYLPAIYVKQFQAIINNTESDVLEDKINEFLYYIDSTGTYSTKDGDGVIISPDQTKYFDYYD